MVQRVLLLVCVGGPVARDQPGWQCAHLGLVVVGCGVLLTVGGGWVGWGPAGVARCAAAARVVVTGVVVTGLVGGALAWRGP